MKLRGLAITVLIMAQFMDLVDSTITNVALVRIQRSLHISSSQLEWILAAYIITFAVLLITGGRLGDIFGRKKVFLIGVAGFGLASLAAATAHNGDILITARVVQGIFGGIMVPQVLSNVQVLYSKEERAKIYGLIGALAALGAVTGLILGGWMVTANILDMGWRSIFYVNIPVCIILLVVGLIVVPESKAEHPLKLDPIGMILVGLTVLLVEFALIEGHQQHWAGWIWAMLIAAPFIGSLFAFQQRGKLRRDGSSLLPMQLFGNRGFSSGLVVQTLFWMANGSYTLIIGYYLQQAVGFTPFKAGLTILPMAIGAIVISAAADPLAKKFGKRLICLGGIIQAAAFVWVIMVISADGTHLSPWDLAAPLGIAGIGLVFLTVPLLDEALSTVSETDAGAASGTFNTFQQVGSALGIAVAGALFFGKAGVHPTPVTFKFGIMDGMWVTVAAFAVAGLVSLILPNHRKAVAPAPDGEIAVEPERRRVDRVV